MAAGGIVLGFVASRFLKASSSERYRSSIDVGRTSRQPGIPPRRLDREPMPSGAPTQAGRFERESPAAVTAPSGTSP